MRGPNVHFQEANGPTFGGGGQWSGANGLGRQPSIYECGDLGI